MKSDKNLRFFARLRAPGKKNGENKTLVYLYDNKGMIAKIVDGFPVICNHLVCILNVAIPLEEYNRIIKSSLFIMGRIGKS